MFVQGHVLGIYQKSVSKKCSYKCLNVFKSAHQRPVKSAGIGLFFWRTHWHVCETAIFSFFPLFSSVDLPLKVTGNEMKRQDSKRTEICNLAADLCICLFRLFSCANVCWWIILRNVIQCHSMLSISHNPKVERAKCICYNCFIRNCNIVFVQH